MARQAEAFVEEVDLEQRYRRLQKLLADDGFFLRSGDGGLPVIVDSTFVDWNTGGEIQVLDWLNVS